MKHFFLAIFILLVCACQSDTSNTAKTQTDNAGVDKIVTKEKSNKAAAQETKEPEIKTIVFVCARGFDKSVIASSYFNEVMYEKRLHYKSVSRAADSTTRRSNSIPMAIITELLATGLTIQSTLIEDVSAEEIETAYKIIYLDKPPTSIENNKKAIFWNGIPPTKAGFDKTTNIIKEKVDKLVKEIGC